jgi:hypothetical protein
MCQALLVEKKQMEKNTMSWNLKHLWPAATLSLIGLASAAHAANYRNDKMTDDRCAPVPGAICYPDDPSCAYCLGPDMVNPAVRPKTCNGDIVLTVAGFYWNSHQDGMEFAVKDRVSVPTIADNQNANYLIDAEYQNPDNSWDFGFKLGLAYNSNHDGWDFGVEWTWFRNRAQNHVETEQDDNQILVPLWSAYQANAVPVLVANDIEATWRLQLNLIDINLGREFWVSKYMTMRPHVGLRIAYIEQDYDIEHKGGSWNAIVPVPAFNNLVKIDNDFKGVGLRSGLDTTWIFGRGWGLYGNFALSIVYGRFSVEHDETNRQASDLHVKNKVLDTNEHFRASRAMTDLSLGIQWSTMFSECCYGLTIQLGWEHHMFFHQNQMWRVNRIGGIDGTINTPNNTGENSFHQRRGTLDTQGWTLTVRFEF